MHPSRPRTVTSDANTSTATGSHGASIVRRFQMCQPDGTFQLPIIGPTIGPKMTPASNPASRVRSRTFASTPLHGQNSRSEEPRVNFCLFRRREQPDTFVPDPTQFPPWRPRPLPYILSEADIIRLLDTGEIWRHTRPRRCTALWLESGSSSCTRLESAVANSRGSLSATMTRPIAFFMYAGQNSTSHISYHSQPIR